MAIVGVIGLGNIGLRTAWLLSRRGHHVVGIDSRMNAVKAAEDMGAEAKLLDALSRDALRTITSRVDVVALALPSSMAYKALLNLASLGVDTVDVSFIRDGLEELESEASTTNTRIIVNAGFAPGLSNVLIARGVSAVDGRRARVYAGGISEDPRSPLGLSATWNTEDLIEEYIRPAKLVKDGKVVEIDPLDGPVERVKIKGIGELECFYTDGLGSLLKTFGHLEELAECTLRWPGHLTIMRGLKSLSMLSRKPVEVSGCPVYPASFLAEILKKVSAKSRDIALLKVVVRGHRGEAEYESIVRSDNRWSATSIAVSSVQAAFVEMLVSGYLPSGEGGVFYPEQFGGIERIYSLIIESVKEGGVMVEERITTLTSSPP